MSDNHTTGVYVCYMAVCNRISYLVGDICITAILSYGFGQETGTEVLKMLLAGFVLYVLPVLSGWAVVWLETIKISLKGD